MRINRYSKYLPDIIRFFILSVGALIMLIPLFWMFMTSFKTNAQIWEYPIRWIPAPITFEHFVTVWEVVPVLRFLFNSLYVSLLTTGLQILTSALAAYAFARILFAYRETILLIFLGTMMIPKYILIIPTYIIMDNFKMLDTYSGLILPGIVSAFSIFLLRQFFINIPKDFDDAAYIDGCNRLQTLFHIIMPLSKPALAALFIFAFMHVWNDFFWPLIVTSSDDLRTLQLALAYFQTANTVEYGETMAISIIATLPILIVFLISQRWFIQGMTMAGVKG